MKSKIALATLCAASLASLLSFGCSFSPNDPELNDELGDNMEYLQRPAASCDKGTRYRMAKELFDRVDLAALKTRTQLFKTLGRPDASRAIGSSQALEYRFVSPDGEPELSAFFTCEGEKIVSSKYASL
jgi:hypothetical protein